MFWCLGVFAGVWVRFAGVLIYYVICGRWVIDPNFQVCVWTCTLRAISAWWWCLSNCVFVLLARSACVCFYANSYLNLFGLVRCDVYAVPRWFRMHVVLSEGALLAVY